MRNLLLFTLSTLLVAGCTRNETHKIEVKTNEAKPYDLWEQVALKNRRSEDVLIRQVTPFDSEPAARQVYLASFYAGYRLGLTGTNMTCCFMGDAHTKAHIQGWYDGQWAGGRAFETNGMSKTQ